MEKNMGKIQANENIMQNETATQKMVQQIVH